MRPLLPGSAPRRAMWLAFVVGLVASGSCASRNPAAAPPDRAVLLVAEADAAAAEGCYTCLDRALRNYEDAARVRRDAATGQKAYRTAVQLVVRERLLGLYPGSHQDAPARLRSLAAPDDVADAEDVLAVLPWRRGTEYRLDAAQVLRREDVDPLRERRRRLDSLADRDAWRAMLLLVLVGSHPAVAVEEGEKVPWRELPQLRPARWRAAHPDDGALLFTRLALAPDATLDDWILLQAERPSFAEALAYVGEMEVRRGRLVSSDAALADALATFPSLIPALALRADVRQKIEDYALALTLYDALLERVPEHREGLLGRLRSLGFLRRHEDAIVTADRMLTLGTWYIGEAQYWKAWNLLQLGRLDEARAAVDAARRLQVNADVEYLSGVIAFRQSRHVDAKRDFDAALALEEDHCEARFDRAALHLVQQVWPSASTEFDEAFTCLRARTTDFEQHIVDARNADLPDALKEALIERREQALRHHQYQLAWARYNAAVAYANLQRADVMEQRLDEVSALGGPAVDAARDLRAQLRRR